MPRIQCKFCPHVSKNQGQATSHAWTHRRAKVAAAKRAATRQQHQTQQEPAAPAKRAYVKRALAHFALSTQDLEMLLSGYEQKAAELDQRMAELRTQLRSYVAKPIPQPAAPKAQKTHRISPEGRKRIAEAQKRRWAAQQAAAVPTAG